jgi:hypothetical protein
VFSPASAEAAADGSAFSTIACGPARTSRQPLLPHQQGGPSILRQRWPNSAALAYFPPSATPSSTMPAPRLLPMYSAAMERAVFPRATQNSPTAAAVASFSAGTGRPVASLS